MKNQKAKYKHPDGQRKHKPQEVAKMTSGLLGRINFPFFRNTKGTNITKPRKKINAKRRYNKMQRKVNRV